MASVTFRAYRSAACWALACMVLAGAQRCDAEPAYASDSSLVSAWHREFAVRGGSNLSSDLRTYPISADSKAIIVLGQTPYTAQTRVAPDTPTGKDYAVWLAPPVLAAKYLELANVSAIVLDSLPASVCEGVTHIQLGPGTNPSAADLKFLRRKFPGLRGLGVSMAEMDGFGEPIAAVDSLVVELTQFTDLTDLCLRHISSAVAKRHGKILGGWLASLSRLKRLDLGFSDIEFFTVEVAKQLRGLEWLTLLGCSGAQHGALWEALGQLDRLRCLGLAGPELSGFNADGVLSLQKFKNIEALDLSGVATLRPDTLCQAVQGLSSLRHLTLPSLGAEADWHKLVKPVGLTKLRSLTLPVFNKVCLPWIAAQVELEALTTRIDGHDWNDVSGLIKGLSVCKHLRSLDLALNLAPADVFAGEYELNVESMRLSLVVEDKALPGIANLIRSCPRLSVLELCVSTVSAADRRTEVPLSAEVWTSIQQRAQLQVLVAKLPPTKEMTRLFEAMPQLIVVYDLDKVAEWDSDRVDAVANAKHLLFLVKVGLSDDATSALSSKVTGLRVLRDRH